MIYQKNKPVIQRKQRLGKLHLKIQEAALSRVAIWKLDHCKFNSLRKQFFQDIEQLEIYSLMLNNNYERSQEGSLISKIIHVKFPCLKQLDLHANRISSIQQIQLLNAFSLKILRLDDNFITSFLPLRKMQFASLQHLQIDRNKIAELSCFSELQIASLQKFFVEYSNHILWEDMQDPSAQWVLKLQSKKINKIALENKYRIKSQNIEQKCRCKFIEIR